MVRLWAAPEQTAHPDTPGTETTTVPPVRHPARSGALMEWLDRFLGSDPGLTRLRTALQAVVTIGAAMAAEWLFVRLTGALQTPVPAGLPADEAAGLAALNHALLVVAIMLGAVIGMLASFAGTMFTTARAQLITFAFLPIPMIAGLTLGLALGPYRVAALASLAVVLAVGTYARRFGPRGFMGGVVAFMGDFFGFFLHAQIALGDLGWLSAEIAVGIVVAAVAQFTLFYPSRRAALRRMMRSYTARARDVARRGLEVFDQPDAPSRARQSRRLHRRLVRLNEAALMIDAQLADPAGVPAGWSPTLVHQAIFDAELALTNLARFIEPLAELPLSADTRTVIRQALTGVAQRDLELADRAGRALLTHMDHGPILLHRFAGSVIGLVAAAHAWQRATAPAAPGAGADGGAAATGQQDTLEAAVTLAAGWLPGSTRVSSTASQQAEDGRGFWDRIQLAPNVRVAIQMGVAVAGAIVFGDLLSGHRFYWAVIAAFVTFMGANNAGEQLRKGMYRVLGTMIGVVLGAIGAHLVDGRAGLAIAVILISMFFGLYLMRISYVFMVIAITIMVSQLYVELNEFSDSLLVLRLEETALGAAVAALTVLCVLPLRTGRVARVAAREYLKAITELTEQAIHRLLEPHGDTAPLRAAARRLDAAYQALLATMTPLRVPFTGAGDNLRKQLLHAASAARHYARNLLVDTMNPGDLDDEQRARLRTAGDQLLASLNHLAGAEEQHHGPAGAQYVRSAALFDLVAQHGTVGVATPLQLALRDLQLIDGAMAAIAHTAGVTVQALDTSTAEQPSARRAHRV